MGSCSCVYVGEADVCSTDLTHETRKARKEHICTECGRTIWRGEKYEKWVTVFEGSIEDSKTCTDCVAIREAFFCDGFLFGTVLSDLHQHIRDMEGSIDSGCIAGLPMRAREAVCQMVEDAWEYVEKREARWKERNGGMGGRKEDSDHSL